MKQPIFIGVDGGGTKCLVRVEDKEGHLLGTGTSGAANIRISVPQTWAAIEAALLGILQPLGMRLEDPNYQFHAGMGLAGCEVSTAYQAFMGYPHSFASLTVVSDAETACLGAHDGVDGAIIIAGTGVVGFQLDKQQVTKIGGWGFPHDDLGGGAWLGLEATKTTLQALDGRLPASLLTDTICNHFAGDQAALVDWANQSNSTGFATLAPLVVTAATKGDIHAIHLLRQAASYLDRISDALLGAQQTTTPLPCVLMGGVSSFLLPYVGEKLRSRLTICQATPDVGAIILARQASAQLEQR